MSYESTLTEEQRAQVDALERVSITIELPKVVSIYLAWEAFSDDRTPEYIATKLLRKIAEKHFDDAIALDKALRAIEAGESPRSHKDRTEREFEGDLATAIRQRGFTVDTQVNTGAGVADIVIYGDYQPRKALGVVEVKLEFSGWREAHRAFGQAQAYAAALGTRRCWVTAPRVDARLLTKRAPHILAWDTAAEVIHKQIGALQIVSAEEG